MAKRKTGQALDAREKDKRIRRHARGGQPKVLARGRRTGDVVYARRGKKECPEARVSGNGFFSSAPEELMAKKVSTTGVRKETGDVLDGCDKDERGRAFLLKKKKTDGCTRAAEKNGEPEARVTAVSFLLGARLTEGKKREKVVPGKGQAVFQPRAKRTKAWVRVRKEKLHVHTSA